MRPLKRIALIVVAALAFGFSSALPAAAQLKDAEALDKRVVELNQAGKYSEAIPLAQRALDIRERELGLQDLQVGQSLLTLGELYLKLNRYAEAEALFRRSLAIYEKSLARDHPNMARPLVNLAQVYRAQGRGAEAEALEKRAPPSQNFEVASAPPPPSAQTAAPRPPPPAVAASPPSAPPRDALTTRTAPTRSMRGPPAGAPSGSPASAPSTLPDFPWPPPAASASYVLPRNLLANRATVGQVSDAIIAALERTGYVERSFFRTQADGVALVTRLEGINDDGTALAEGKRWPTLQDSKDLMSAVRGLFFVDRGLYRVIVFVLQDLPFVPSPNQVTGQDARAWLRTGANVLPHDIANRPYGDANCSVLIYEFASDGTAVRMIDSRLTAKQHLEKAGVWAILEKSN